MMKKFSFIFVLTVMAFMALGISSADIIDDSALDKGIVKVTYKATDDVAYRVLVVKGDKKIVYPFFADGRTDAFPLQMGNGTYTVGLLKNVGEKRYVYVEQKKVTLSLSDPNVVYLNSVQNVEWQKTDAPIQYGAKLIGGIKGRDEQLKKLYGYVVDNVEYDYGKIENLTTEYVPNILSTYKTLTGICYDYSALVASIQRSQGVPTRLVKGYSKFTEGYHAWNEVFIGGEWYIVDTTVDATLKGSKTKPTMVKNSKDYTKVNDY